VEGKLVKGVKIEEAEKAVMAELEKIKTRLVSEQELQKVKNKTESMIAFEDMSVMSRANSLAYYENLGDAAWMNEELLRYGKVTAEIYAGSRKIFRGELSTIYYLAKGKDPDGRRGNFNT
jgi:predicted Zn-dependent peptidase